MKRMLGVVAVCVGMALASTGHAANLYWDPTLSGGTALGGDGTWDWTTANWWNGSSHQVWAQNNNAIFEGTAGTVTMGSSSRQVSDLTVNSSGYTFVIGGNSPGQLTFSGAASGFKGTAVSGTTLQGGMYINNPNSDLEFNGILAGSTTWNQQNYDGRITLTSGMTFTTTGSVNFRNKLRFAPDVAARVTFGNAVDTDRFPVLELPYGDISARFVDTQQSGEVWIRMTSGGGSVNNPGAAAGFAAIGGDRKVTISNVGDLLWDNGAVSSNMIQIGTLVLSTAESTGKLTLSHVNEGTGKGIRLATAAATRVRWIRADNGAAEVDAEITCPLMDGTSADRIGQVIKTGDGVLAFSGNNTYSGGTIVSAGTLLVNNTSGSGTGSGNVIVEGGATLGGTGAIVLGSGNSVTVNAGGTLTGTLAVTGGGTVIAGTHSPGNSPGISNHANLTYNAGAKVEWELIANGIGTRGVHFDGIDVSGDLTFSGATSLDLVFNLAESSVAWGNTFWNTSRLGVDGWLIYDVAGATSGFANLSLNVIDWLDSNGATLHPYGQFSLYLDGNDIYLNYALIPEPASFVLLALAGLALLRRRR